MTTNVNAKNEFYSCAICGIEHESVEARNSCEAKCINERKAAEELMKKQKLEEEREARKQEIDAMYELLNTKIREYVRDYGSIRVDRAIKYDNNFTTSSNLFNLWSL